ncbi:MAG: molecular chaperone DnaJ [Rhodospirillales bacterium]|nr:molecular chaperone DnaJ [Alphaproteobacteria bacterium]MCB9987203.1 molecular chaperone DnaJ [Rhodospirillales bacterium]USO07935.1 MAG: molecular chaperone DnaJ [Rhodospirillales bacterium]
MADTGYYDVLGVAKTATDAEIKSAFRKLAMQFHPDKNPGDKKAEAKFKEINHAYDILKDSEKRAAYDRYGAAAFEGGMGGARGGNPFGQGGNPFGQGGFEFNFGGGAGGFSDIFEEMFGDIMGGARGGRQGGGARGGYQSGAARGSDLQYGVEITLEDAFKGTEKTIRVPTFAACDTCHGSGAKAGTKPETCPTCKGQGRVRAQQGFFTIERGCPTCGGAGQVIKEKCTACGGAGRVRREKTLKVNIPSGIEHGRRIRLAGEGEAGANGGPAGDLYVLVNIKAHKLFTREGADLHCRVPIAMSIAALGGAIEVPTIEGGRAEVKLPAGTQTGQQFRLKAKGMSMMRSSARGDMYIELFVETPVHLSKKQKELLAEFAGNDPSANSPESQGFFKKVKEFWNDLTD